MKERKKGNEKNYLDSLSLGLIFCKKSAIDRLGALCAGGNSVEDSVKRLAMPNRGGSEGKEMAYLLLIDTTLDVSFLVRFSIFFSTSVVKYQYGE
jgi:hypothetical protein